MSQAFFLQTNDKIKRNSIHNRNHIKLEKIIQNMKHYVINMKYIKYNMKLN